MNESIHQRGGENANAASLANSSHLDLSHSNLVSLPDEIDYTRYLSIDLSHNPLKLKERDYERIAHIIFLDLTATGLKTVPTGVTTLHRLQGLNMANNALATLPRSMSQLTNLEKLILRGNRYAVLPRQILSLRLKVLDLSLNRMADIGAEIARLTHLEMLVLGVERGHRAQGKKGDLTSIPDAISRLTNLRQLIIGNHKLTALPDALGGLTSLELLDVSGNCLSDLPSGLATIILRGLIVRLDGNPLRDPLPEVIARGPEVLATYLASLEDAVEQYEAKLLMVGEGNVGKTSLVRRLTGRSFIANQPTTHGIEISHLQLPHPSLPIPLVLHIWDFGGQEVYRITHQFFFSQRAIYLVTWHPRQGQEQDEVDGWLRRIRLRVGESLKALIVSTHADERSAELDYPLLRTTFGNILAGQHAVDTKSNSGMESLKLAISQHAADLPQMGQRLSLRWIKCRDTIIALGSDKPHVNYDDFVGVCVNLGMTIGEVKPFLELMHDLGHVIYYGSDEGLRDVIVLNPEWLTKAIGAVLEDRETRAGEGILSHSRLREIWSPAQEGGYDSRYHPYFLRLMEKYDVSYRLEDDEGRSLVAQLVPYERPTLPWGNWSGLPFAWGVTVNG